MRHIDLFSGMLGFSEALRRAFPESYELVLACEIEPACQRVILHHRPGVRLVKDVRGLHCARDEADVITFGSPCQDLSVAGRREGLAGERSGLFFDAVRILEEVRPRWFIFENVPGLLSSNNGRDMGTVLGEFSKLGYWWSYRVLDAQHFGVPQRRRRVFVIGHSGGGIGPLSVLFEPESVCGDPPPSRKARDHKGPSSDGDGDGAPLVVHTLRAEYDASEDGTGRGTPIVPVAFSCKDDGRDVSELSPTLRSMSHDKSHMNGGGQVAVAVAQNQRGELRTSDIAPQLTCGGGKPGQGYPAVAYTLHGADKTVSTATETEIAGSIRTKPPGSIENSTTTVALSGMQVRRLTPLECLRLQGFPDDWLDGMDLSDSAKYRMIGNGVALPVVEWIARRLAAHEEK